MGVFYTVYSLQSSLFMAEINTCLVYSLLQGHRRNCCINTTFCNVIMAKCALVPFDTCYIIPYGAWIKQKNLTYETVFINDQLGKLLTQH